MPRSAVFHNIATRRSSGASVLSSSIRLGVSSADTSEMPVRWPPGRARLWTQPVPTGSPAPNHHYRCGRSLLGGECGGIAEGDDDIDLAGHQFVDEARQTVYVP